MSSSELEVDRPRSSSDGAGALSLFEVCFSAEEAMAESSGVKRDLVLAADGLGPLGEYMIRAKKHQSYLE